MRIPFDITKRPQIESGEYKVETRNGNPIRVLAWDLPNDFPIATAEFTEDNRVIVESYSADGWVGYGEKENNLFIITPEPELSEFEKGLVDFFNKRIALALDKGDMLNRDDLDELLHKTAAELFELAKKELCESGDVTDWYAKGKAEALKDLPRWIPNKFDKHNFETCKAYLDTPRYLCYQDKMIEVSELVEKLPGFKEDEK